MKTRQKSRTSFADGKTNKDENTKNSENDEQGKKIEN